MKEGDIILTAISQADGKMKNRPALYLREMPPPFRDCLLCGISMQLQQEIKEFDERIVHANHDFKQSGLLAESLIRLSFLAVVPKSKIIGTIGSISEARHKHLLTNLSLYLTKKQSLNSPNIKRISPLNK